MNKSMLVIDTPKSCNECLLCLDGVCTIIANVDEYTNANRANDDYEIPFNCPLQDVKETK